MWGGGEVDGWRQVTILGDGSLSTHTVRLNVILMNCIIDAKVDFVHIHYIMLFLREGSPKKRIFQRKDKKYAYQFNDCFEINSLYLRTCTFRNTSFFNLNCIIFIRKKYIWTSFATFSRPNP